MSVFEIAKELEGAEYHEGWNDCYTSAQVLYKRALNLDLIDFSRPRYWDQVNEFNFFDRLFEQQGFFEIGSNASQASVGDALLMCLGHGVCLNHVAIYVGQNQILHHIQGRKRVVESYSHKWRLRVRKVIRHPKMESIFNGGASLSSANLPQALKNKVYGGHGG